MNNFNEDLREIIKQKQEYGKMRTAFILNKDTIESFDSHSLKQLRAIDPDVNDHMNLLFRKLNNNILTIKEEGQKRNWTFEINSFKIPSELIDRYVDDIKNTEEKRIEFVLSGNKNSIRELERKLLKQEINIIKVFETDQPIRSLSEFKNEVIRGYVLDLKSAELLYQYLDDNKENLSNITSRMYCHIDTLANFDIRSNFKINIEEGSIGMDKLKFPLHILKQNTIEETFRSVFNFQVQSAIDVIGLDKKSIFDYMPLEKSDNLLKILDIIEKNKLYKNLEEDEILTHTKKIKP